ncbi:MAG: 1-(5-phosphoribosyl)-5-[(5-phosphoribosylamino)methylideneamino]imidazole-4-carboxamide isomerase [Coriobacteriia bacterium]|nr:1-(5-phosphoribosyl)-5-[(5-phosphoribosylamino)methylideneamino]imidazole-4-carboxamide isomerase [Coriobacteriia bacterium]
MIVFPAIDLLGGRVVRLAQGDYDRVTVYNEDPVAQARVFAEAGATWVHVVDLDGARNGVPGNIAIVERIARATGLAVQAGGGIRTLDTMRRLVDAGASRMVLGTKLVTDEEFVADAVAGFGDAVVAGIDARDGEVRIAGWREGTGVPAAGLVAELADCGIRHLVYTDISRDGMGTGISGDAYRAVAAGAGFPVMVSGGMSSIADVRTVVELGEPVAEGVIIGRALYEGTIELADALAVVREGC